MGLYDQGGNGFPVDKAVGLYDTSQTLLASATITSSSQLVDGFRYVEISPVTIPSGTYRLAVFNGPSNEREQCMINPVSITLESGVSYVFDVSGGGTSGLGYPQNTDGLVPVDIGPYGPVLRFSESDVCETPTPTPTITPTPSPSPSPFPGNPIISSVTNPSHLIPGTSQSIGWEFTLSCPSRTVTYLGLYDEGGDGFPVDKAVGLYDTSQTLLASATITSSSQLVDGFRYVEITPVTIPSGTYRLAVFNGPSNERELCMINPVSITLESGVSYVSDVSGGGTSGLGYPQNSNTIAAINDGPYGPVLRFSESDECDTSS